MSTCWSSSPGVKARSSVRSAWEAAAVPIQTPELR